MAVSDSDDAMRYNVPDADESNTMLAMLLPPTFVSCVVMQSDSIDFRATIRKILAAFTENEFACALGVNDCSLEMELLSDKEIGEIGSC